MNNEIKKEESERKIVVWEKADYSSG